MKRILSLFALLLIFAFASSAQARSGCCSRHDGVCGCSCCDGTSLSSTCAPYYPKCNGSAPPVTPAPTKVVIPTSKPIVIPTSKPTVKPTLLPTVKPTVKPTTKPIQLPTVTLKPTEEVIVTPTIKVEQKTLETKTQSQGFWNWLMSLFRR